MARWHRTSPIYSSLFAGMLNKGVLGLHVPVGPFKRAPLLTITVVWN
jgi:hypothetical protein